MNVAVWLRISSSRKVKYALHTCHIRRVDATAKKGVPARETRGSSAADPRISAFRFRFGFGFGLAHVVDERQQLRLMTREHAVRCDVAEEVAAHGAVGGKLLEEDGLVARGGRGLERHGQDGRHRPARVHVADRDGTERLARAIPMGRRRRPR